MERAANTVCKDGSEKRQPEMVVLRKLSSS